MSLLYLRKVRITFPGGFVVNPGSIVTPNELKAEFSVTKDLSGTQNDGTIQIWNLKEANRNAVGKELKDVRVEAGYMPPTGGATFGQIAYGQIRDVKHERDGADIITTITLGEGDRAARQATISKTIPAGTKVTEVVDQIFTELEKQGLKRGEFKFSEEQKALVRKRPVTMHGDAMSEMQKLGRAHGFYASAQGEALEIVSADDHIGGIIVLSKTTGLKGVPTITDAGVSAAALFNPGIVPGRRVRIVSETLEMNSAGDTYRVASATYNGSTHSSAHDVQFTADALNANGKVASEDK